MGFEKVGEYREIDFAFIINIHTCLMSPKNSSPPVKAFPSDTFNVTSALS